MPSTKRPYRVESKMDEPGEGWKVYGTYGTPEKAQEIRDEIASIYHQMDWRVVDTTAGADEGAEVNA